MVQRFETQDKVSNKAQPKRPSALKHGDYSGLTLMTGEDPAAFKRLHRDLVAELNPQGRLEEETVAEIARLLWRKQNLSNYEIVQLTRTLADGLELSLAASQSPEQAKNYISTIPQLEAIVEAEEKRAAETAPEAHTLEDLDIRKMATLNGLMRELDVEERLGVMIDKCVKRLFFLKGCKPLIPTREIPRTR